ncbi:hypothetical protein DL93DRAFT_63198 [Clavulina sp. PMI_390]|nr:hypothetical protein DL93DRAFT_63198 [Clavulina sp. PMI_390]
MDAFIAFATGNVLSTLALALAPNYLARVATCGVVLALYSKLYNLVCSWQAPHPALPYIAAAAVSGMYIWELHWLVFTPNPHRQFAPRDSAPPLSAMDRLRWATRVKLSPRQIGFVSEIPGIPSPSAVPESRGRFLVNRLAQISRNLLFMTCLWTPVIWFDLEWFISPDSQSKPPRFLHRAVGEVWGTILLMQAAYTLLYTISDFIFITWVILGASTPKECPPMFGPFFGSSTLAGCWSRTWHSTFRVPFLSFADAVLHILGISPDSKSSLVFGLKALVAFVLSGLFHGAGDYAMFRGKQWFSPQFFFLQPFALVAERLVIRLGDRFAFRRRFPLTSTILGHVWVVVWFTLTFPGMTKAFWDGGPIQEASQQVREIRQSWNMTIFLTPLQSTLSS